MIYEECDCLEPDDKYETPWFISKKALIVGPSLVLELRQQDRKHFIKEVIQKQCKVHKWLTINNCAGRIEAIAAYTKIHLTCKSRVTAYGCLFIPRSILITESAVEIFANSSGYFNECSFTNAPRVALMVRNCSTAVFDKCVFTNNKTSLLIMDNSSVIIKNCVFENDAGVSIIASKNSQVLVENSTFSDSPGKAIICKEKSLVIIKDCTFSNLKHGALQLSDESHGDFFNSKVLNNGSSAIYSSNSELNCVGALIEGVDGKALYIKNSSGCIQKSCFSNTKQTTLFFSGMLCNIVLEDCCCKNSDSLLCLCENLAVPTFNKCCFSNTPLSAFVIQNYAFPRVSNCTFTSIAHYTFIVTNHGMLDAEEQRTYNAYFTRKGTICSRNVLEYYVLGDDDFDFGDEGCKVKPYISPTYKMPPPLERDAVIPSVEPLKRIPFAFVLDNDNGRCTEGDFVNLPCGHITNDNDSNKCKCEVCGCAVRDVKSIYVEDECSLCMDKKSSVLITPCSHLCLCADCGFKCVLRNIEKCPLCSSRISGIKSA